MGNVIEKSRQELISELDRRVEDQIIEKSNAELLKKLIANAETLTEAIAIAELGTTYKRTGFHFDKRLEKIGSTIKYLEKNEHLSFSDNIGGVTNKLIIGDNYDALLNLLVQYKGQVDVIYIDPPYGKDSMGEFAQTNYDNAITRDNLLSMLYPRLLIAKELLANTGCIFCSIDDKNQAYVKCLFDEIFNESNFIGTMIWRKKTGGGQTDEFFVTEHEYLIGYRKSADFKWIDYKEDVNELSFKYSDSNGEYAISKLEKWGSSAHREDRPTMYYAIKDPDGKDFFPIAPDGEEGRWRVGKKRMDALVESDGIHWNLDKEKQRWIPYEKCYMKDAKGKLIKTRSIVYSLAETGTATKVLTSIFGKKDVFQNPKPYELIELILQHTKSDVVLDFFAGSGTTGHAVLNANQDGENRQFILCTNNEVTKTTPNGIAYDVTSKRLKRIMTGSCYDGTADFKWLENNEPLGGSLDVYEIKEVADFENVAGQTPFDVIDETLYGKEKFATLKEKIDWVCNNFEITQRQIEQDEEWRERLEGNK